MSEPRPLRDRLMDDLRFGPMTHYMMGWPEAQRQMLVESVADDLIRSGYSVLMTPAHSAERAPVTGDARTPSPPGHTPGL